MHHNNYEAVMYGVSAILASVSSWLMKRTVLHFDKLIISKELCNRYFWMFNTNPHNNLYP